MLEVVNGVVIPSFLTHRAALCFHGKEIVVCSQFESEDEAVTWGVNEWSRIQNRLSTDELQRLGWIKPELRYWP